MLRRLLICVGLAAVVFPAAAVAHVTIQPGEWEAGAFAAMAVRVPNERDDAETTRVTVQFPENVLTARFQANPFCEREVEREELDQPVEEITERIVSVTWTCDPPIASDGFEDFGLSFQVPEDAQPGDEILFPTVQVYSSGERVRWVDPDPEGDTPAPRIVVVAPEEEEAEPAPAATTTEAEAAPAVAADDDDDSSSTMAMVFGIAGLAAGLIALGVALFRKPKATTT
ncbi:MAG: YcnI family protein [Gaiellaceae bacterium]